MLMVTHHMAFAKEFADRIAFFHSGKIEEVGPPDTFFAIPRSDRKRQFLKAVPEAA